MLRPATPLTILLAAAFVLLLISVISTPIITAIPLASYAGVNFGVFGYCKDGTCSNVEVGYNTASLYSDSQEATFDLPLSTRTTLSAILIVHPVAAVFTLIMLILAGTAHFHSPSHSPRYLLGLFILSVLTLILSLLSFLIDVLLFVPHMAWGSYLVLAATILIAASGIVSCAMRRTLVSRKARKRRIAENAEMNGENFYAREGRAPDAVPPVNTMMSGGAASDKLPAFATFEMQKKEEAADRISDERMPLTTRTPTGSSMNNNANGQGMEGNGGPSPPRDQYGNPGPPGAYGMRSRDPSADPSIGDPSLNRQYSDNSANGRGRGMPYRGRGGYGPPVGRGGYGPPPNGRGGYGPPPNGRGGYGPAPGPRGGYRGGYGGPPGRGGYGPPGYQGQPGFQGQPMGPPMGPPGMGQTMEDGMMAGAVGGMAAGAMMRGGRGGRGGPPPQYGRGGYDNGRGGYDNRGMSPYGPRQPMEDDSNMYGRNTSPRPPPVSAYAPYVPEDRRNSLPRAESPPPLDGMDEVHPEGPIGVAVEMDATAGHPSPSNPPPDFNHQYGPLRDSDADVAGMVGLQQQRQDHLAPFHSPVSESRYSHDEPHQDWVDPNGQPPVNSHSQPVELPSDTPPGHRRGNSGDDYYEDVAPRFADPPPAASTAVPSSLAPGYHHTHHQHHNSGSLAPFGSDGNGSYEDIHSGQRSPAESDRSNFTSISQRGINPQWNGPPQGYGPPMPMNRRPVNNGPQRNDMLLNSNPDFQLALPAGRGRGGGPRRGRGPGPAPPGASMVPGSAYPTSGL